MENFNWKRKGIKNNIDNLLNEIQSLKQNITSLENKLNNSINNVSLNTNTLTFTKNNGNTVSINLNELQKWNEYYTKTNLTDNSTTLKLREAHIGRYDSSKVKLYSYDASQFIMEWNADINWIIGTGDKRFGQASRGAVWRGRE